MSIESTSGRSDCERATRVSKPKVTGLEPFAVSPREACRLLGVSNTHLWMKVLPGLESYHEGRTRRITLASIKRYIERRLAENPANSQRPRRGRPRKVPLQSVAGVTGQPEATT
jgi:hypothetical protein